LTDVNQSDHRRVVAILGGTGWLGRHLCPAFARHGYRVVVVARRPRAHVADHPFLPLDLVTAPVDAMAAALRAEGVDVVVNATDSANATDGWDRTEAEHFRFNAATVERLLVAVASLPRRVRLVHLGTIHEYGPVSAGTLIDEGVPPRPVSAYARSKLAGSTAVLRAARAGSVDAVVLRLVSLCGPHPSAGSLPGALVGLLRGVESAGGEMALSIAEARRDFLDVRDAADAVVSAAGAGVTGRAINIGSGVPVEIRTLVTMFVTAAGYPASVIRERQGRVESFGGDWTRADIRLARELLGWRPRISLPDSLRAMWEAGTATEQINWRSSMP
jgi:nucleoside-diphosphate-sugar epimerase